MNKSVKVILENNLSNLLSSYLLRQKSLLECIEWFSTIDWGSIDINSEIARRIGKLQVISTEVSEGLRPESEFEKEVSEIAAKMFRTSCTRYWVSRLEVNVISSSSTANIDNAIFTPALDLESQSWSILPPVVSA